MLRVVCDYTLVELRFEFFSLFLDFVCLPEHPVSSLRSFSRTVDLCDVAREAEGSEHAAAHKSLLLASRAARICRTGLSKPLLEKLLFKGNKHPQKLTATLCSVLLMIIVLALIGQLTKQEYLL